MKNCRWNWSWLPHALFGIFVGAAGHWSAHAGLADDFANPYAGLGVSAAVSNQVKTLTWCSLGTSVTDFDDNPTAGRTQGYQSYAMELLGWDHAKLLNVGHSGTTVGLANDFPKTTPYDVYTVEFGINDWATGHIVGTLSDFENYKYGNAVRWHNFAACYRYVIEGIRAANPNAIIVLTTPRKGYGYNGTLPDNCDDLTLESSMTVDYWDPETQRYLHERTRLADYAALIRQIAAKENLVLCDWYAYAADQDNLADLSVDVALHPNDEGYRIMAQMLAPKILEAVAQASGLDPAGPEPSPEPTPGSAAGPVAYLRNVSCVVAVGSELNLPTTVKGLDANGVVAGDVAVTWPSATVSYDEPDVYTVVGRSANDVTKRVTASVRVVPYESDPNANVASKAAGGSLTATVFYNDVENAVRASETAYVIDGNIPDMNSQPSAVLSTFTDRVQGHPLTLNFTLAKQETIVKAVFYFYSNGNYKLPTGVTFTDGTGQSIMCNDPVDTAVDQYGHRLEYSFPAPVTTEAVKAVFSSAGYLLLAEGMLMADGEPVADVTPKTAATLEAVTVDGVTFEAFDPAVYQYTVLGETIGAEATDNAAVTILPKTDDFVRVITLSEDGLTSLTYVFETATVRYLRNVAVPTSRGRAPVLPSVVKGLSSSGSVLSDVSVVWDDVPPPTTAVQYVVNGHAVANAALKVAASVRVVEPTGEAGEPTNVALASNGGSIVSATVSNGAALNNTGILIDGTIPQDDAQPAFINSWTTDRQKSYAINVTLGFANISSVSSIRVFGYNGNNYAAPDMATFTNAQGQQIPCKEPVVTKISDARYQVDFELTSPVSTWQLTGSFKRKGDDAFTSLTEVQVWTAAEPIVDLTPLAGAKPGMIKVDGRDLEGYDPDVLAYKARSGMVTATFGTEANANMGITVLPRHDKVTRVIALSEDGQTMRTYELTSKPGLVIVFR